ncbi:MAG: NAD-dependent epimerase/dehydratase family protein [Acidimicrobiales bacterium]
MSGASAELPLTLSPGDRVAVTGAAGFIGSAIVRELLAREASVVALVAPGEDEANLEGLELDTETVDVRDRRDVRAAVEGARVVFHAAALFRFWAKEPNVFYDVNVQGTRNVVEAAVEAGCQKVVYTSTVATIGLRPGSANPSDERVHAHIDHLFGNYKQTKYVAEHEVLRLAAEGAPVSLVHPTFPLGPRDIRPTPTGKVLLDFLNGRMPGFVDTAMNVAHVEDLAHGHLLVLEQGRRGRGYILGGENLSMRALLQSAAALTGLPAPGRQWPGVVGLGVGHLSDLIEGRLLRREPHVPLEAARMSRQHMVFDDARARTELGYRSRPATEAIADSARWFVDHGYVRPERAKRITWAEPAD